MLLEKIQSPEDLKTVPVEQLPSLAEEIRGRIIDVVSKTGGHLASSLGAVEIALAVHYCFSAPQDIIVWDVGHQAYAHKIITGRNERFSTLRQHGGISGFPLKSESVYDPFSTGHSAAAVSMALGTAAARDLRKSQEKVVAIIGDGTLTGGMCFEALNHAGHLGTNVLVILNSNDMAIAPSVGALSTYLNKIISKPVYNRFKEARDAFLKQRLPKIGPRLLRLVDRFEEMLKGLIVPGIFFEEMGFKYFGPLDGHNVELMIRTLKNISQIKGPLLLHVVTKKGKGYAPAESQPVKFHGTPCFDIINGEAIGILQKSSVSCTDVFGCKLCDLAQKNKNIVAITAAMPEGTGLQKFSESYPDRFFDVGIAEEHAIGFSAGLAKGGLKPFVAVYSTFLQRAYDQIFEEVCLQNLGVVLCIDRAGLVGEDGPTHHGIFDLAFLRHLPNLTVMAPADRQDLEGMLEFACDLETPASIRFPKDVCGYRPQDIVFNKIHAGKGELLCSGEDIGLIGIGSMVYPCLEAAKLLSGEGFRVSVANARFVKPLDEALILELYRSCKVVMTVEEGVVTGGFGGAVLETYAKNGCLYKAPKPIKCCGLPSEFITFDRRASLLEKYGLSASTIASTARALFENYVKG